MNQVYDNNYLENFLNICSLIDTTSNGKKFSFNASNVHYIVQSFDNQFVIDMNVYNRSSYIVFNTSISDDKSIRRIFR